MTPTHALAWLALLASGPALAQSPAAAGSPAARFVPEAPRTLFASLDSVKTDDGRSGWVETSVRYDPGSGLYAFRTTEADGRILSERTTASAAIAPTIEEAAAARAAILAHPDVAAAVRAARGPVRVDGGFPLVREAGAACGPGARCATFDVIARTPTGPRRVRYVVVDLRDLRVVSADADAVAEGNLAHPAARRQSRSQR